MENREWKELEGESSLGVELKTGKYRARVVVCDTTEENALRNRQWRVWSSLGERERLIAWGYCYTTKRACQIAEFVIDSHS